MGFGAIYLGDIWATFAIFALKARRYAVGIDGVTTAQDGKDSPQNTEIPLTTGILPVRTQGLGNFFLPSEIILFMQKHLLF